MWVVIEAATGGGSFCLAGISRGQFCVTDVFRGRLLCVAGFAARPGGQGQASARADSRKLDKQIYYQKRKYVC